MLDNAIRVMPQMETIVTHLLIRLDAQGYFRDHDKGAFAGKQMDQFVDFSQFEIEGCSNVHTGHPISEPEIWP